MRVTLPVIFENGRDPLFERRDVRRAQVAMPCHAQHQGQRAGSRIVSLFGGFYRFRGKNRESGSVLLIIGTIIG